MHFILYYIYIVENFLSIDPKLSSQIEHNAIDTLIIASCSATNQSCCSVSSDVGRVLLSLCIFGEQETNSNQFDVCLSFVSGM